MSKGGRAVNVKCPHCGTEYEIDKGELYRYVKCEVCGKGFVSGATTSLQMNDGDAAQSMATSPGVGKEESTSAPQRKPRLGIRRPSASPLASPDNHVETTGGLDVNGVNIINEMRRKDDRQKMLHNFLDSIVLLSTLVVLVALGVWWMWHKNKIAEDELRIHVESEAERIRLSAEKDRVERERREKDRLEREASLEKKHAEELREQQERERVEREKRDNQERYQMYLMALRENDFRLFGDVVTNNMEKTVGELCYMLPFSETSSIVLYHSLYETNGVRHVFKLYEDGLKEELDAKEFDGRIKDAEYIVAKGDRVYFRSTRKSPWTGVLNKTKDGDPAEPFWGSLAPAMKSLKAAYEELTFDVFFTPKGTDKRIFVANIEFGGSYSIEMVREAIEREYPLKSGSVSSKVKKFKRTVKIWNGSLIKRGVDGITYVPVTPPARRKTWYTSNLPGSICHRTRMYSYTDQDYGRWASLHELAIQEEAKEKEFYEQQRLERSQQLENAQSAAEKKWRDKIDRIFNGGTLTYSIRKAKIKR